MQIGVADAAEQDVDAYIVRADVAALDLTRDPEAFITLQRGLAGSNLSDPEPPAPWHWFFGSHPTTAERIALAEDWARLEGRP